MCHKCLGQKETENERNKPHCDKWEALEKQRKAEAGVEAPNDGGPQPGDGGDKP